MSRETTNRYLRRIVQVTGEADLNRAVVSLVGRYQKSGESLEDIAHGLGVPRVRLQAMHIDGGVFSTDEGRVIRLNSLSDESRRRFTLAHEIGHLIIEQLGKWRNVSCGSERASELEKACDKIAAELLMPTADVVRLVKTIRGETPASLRRLARRYKVSLHAMAIRLHDLRLWNRSVGLWEKKGESRQLWFVGTRPWTSSRQDFDVFSIAKRTGDTVSAREFCWKGAGLQAVSLQVVHLGRDLLLATVSEGVVSRVNFEPTEAVRL